MSKFVKLEVIHSPSILFVFVMLTGFYEQKKSEELGD